MCVAWAPGRVNLIGEHTDYSGGLVLPVAIQYGVSIDVARRRGTRSRSARSGFGAAPPFAADGSGPAAKGWARYAQAVAAELDLLGRPPVGLTGTVDSDLPVGAGLSSSAALEVAVALALCAVAEFEVEPLELALGVPARGAAGRRRAVRDPRPGRVASRARRPGDAARLRHARAPARPGARGRCARGRRLGGVAHTARDVGLRAAAASELEAGMPETASRHVRTENRRVRRLRGGARGPRPRGGRDACCSPATRACATTTRSRSPSSTCSSSSRRQLARTAPGCSAAASAARSSRSRRPSARSSSRRRRRAPTGSEPAATAHRSSESRRRCRGDARVSQRAQTSAAARSRTSTRGSSSRYRSAVSGPQLAVPSPRCAWSRLRNVSGRGSRSYRVPRRGQVGRR